MTAKQIANKVYNELTPKQRQLTSIERIEKFYILSMLHLKIRNGYYEETNE